MMMGSRETGKSFMVGAGLVPHMFITDGATAYTEAAIDSPSPVEILVGAEISDKSKDILKKSREAIEMLPGSYQLATGRIEPSPFSKQFKGS